MRVCTHSIVMLLVCLLLGLGLPVRAGRAALVRCYERSFDLDIPADPNATKGWTEDALIEVPDHFTIADLNVSVRLTHTNVFDLQLYVTSPSGTTVLLNSYDPFTEYFEGADYRGTVFDDEATRSISEGVAPFTGSFRPASEGALSAFDGEDVYGCWRLRIYDAYYLNDGHLGTFELIVTPAPEPATVIWLLAGLGFVGLSKCRAR